MVAVILSPSLCFPSLCGVGISSAMVPTWVKAPLPVVVFVVRDWWQEE